MTKFGAYAGFITGTLVSIFWLFFIHLKESKPLMICKAIFGVDSLAEGTLWAIVDPLVIALPASIIMTLVLNPLGRIKDSKYVEACFKGLK